jgi:copper chaperone CopZ
VQGAEVSFALKQAVVRYDPSQVTVEQMVAAIKDIGFSATLHR